MNSLALDVSAEPLLLPRQLLLERLVRLPDRLDLEQALHVLQRDTTSLGDEEEGIEECEEGQCREEEVHAVAHRGKHLFSEARHEKVEQPVAGRCAGLGYGAEVRIEEFLVMPCQSDGTALIMESESTLTELMTHGVPFQVGV